MTYNVFSGTLNPTQSMQPGVRQWSLPHKRASDAVVLTCMVVL